MSLDVYFKNNIADVLTSNALAVILTAGGGKSDEMFVRGALAMARVTAVAFGVQEEVQEALRVAARVPSQGTEVAASAALAGYSDLRLK